MEYLKKFSEAVEIAQMKKSDLEKIMGLVMYECRNIENQCKTITDLYTGLSRRQNEIDLENKRLEIRSNELDIKERILDGREKCIDLKEKQLQAREHEADGKDKSLLIRFSELDSQEKNVEGRIKEIDSREKLLDAREHKADGKELFLSRRKREIESEAKKLTKRLMNRLHSKEIFLEGRKKEIDSREKKLHAREHKAGRKEKYLSRRQSEIDSEAKKLMKRFNELDSKEMFLEGRENDVAAKEKILARREHLYLKEFTLGTRSSDVESRVKFLEKRENSVHSELEKMERKKLELLKKAEELVNLFKEHGLKEQLFDLDLTLDVPKNSSGQFIQEPVYSEKIIGPVYSRSSAKCAKVVRSRKKRCSDSGISDASQEMNMEGRSSQQRKRNRSCGSNGQLQPHDHQNSDMMANFAAKYTGHPSSFDIGTEKGELWRNVNIGDVWACFDSKYELPRSHAQVIRIFDMDGKDWLEVAWLKPRPVFDGENAWINADLPVTCGEFYCSGVNIASPKILCHPVSCVGESPWTIIPCEGETWAIYKDWNITTWSSYPNIHQNCEYEIIEIVSDHQVETTCGVRVAYLDKIMGSQNLFQRRSNNGENSFLMDRTCLYRFSHRVRSVQKNCIDANGTLHCVFELDQKCLPEEFR